MQLTHSNWTCKYVLNEDQLQAVPTRTGGAVYRSWYSDSLRVRGSGVESRWGRDFSYPSKPAPGRTQPPVQGVLGHSRG